MKSNILFITGTDTEIGKTIHTLTISSYFSRLGLHTITTKPIMCGDDFDYQMINQYLSPQSSQNQYLYFFNDPISPHLAAKNSNHPIDLDYLVHQCLHLSTQCDLLIIEGIGGIMVPLTQDSYVIDWIKKLNADLLLICPNQLGILNHALLTIHAANHYHIPIAGFMMNHPNKKSDSSQMTNLDEIQHLSKLNCWGNIPFLDLSQKNWLENAQNHLFPSVIFEYLNQKGLQHESL